MKKIEIITRNYKLDDPDNLKKLAALLGKPKS